MEKTALQHKYLLIIMNVNIRGKKSEKNKIKKMQYDNKINQI